MSIVQLAEKEHYYVSYLIEHLANVLFIHCIFRKIVAYPKLIERVDMRALVQIFSPVTIGAPAPEGVLALQTNFYINQMRELMSDASRVKTKGCKKHGKALSHFCNTCELAICEECCLTDHKDVTGHQTQDINRYFL